jgi:hypothetical protein
LFKKKTKGGKISGILEIRLRPYIQVGYDLRCSFVTATESSASSIEFALVLIQHEKLHVCMRTCACMVLVTIAPVGLWPHCLFWVLVLFCITGGYYSLLIRWSTREFPLYEFKQLDVRSASGSLLILDLLPRGPLACLSIFCTRLFLVPVVA